MSETSSYSSLLIESRVDNDDYTYQDTKYRDSSHHDREYKGGQSRYKCRKCNYYPCQCQKKCHRCRCYPCSCKKRRLIKKCFIDKPSCTDCGYRPCRCEELCHNCKSYPCSCHKLCSSCGHYPCHCPAHTAPYCPRYVIKGGRWPPSESNLASKKDDNPTCQPPVNIAVGPGGDFEDINDALDFLSKKDNRGLNSPTNGYQLILKNGVHRLKTDHHTNINILRLRSQSWHPTMGMSYIQGAGRAQEFIPQFYDQYQKNVGGLGPWKLDVCGKRVTVCGSINPDFSDLVCGDNLFWFNKKDKIICYTVDSAKCNTIWIKQCFDNDCVTTGEGFWIGNRSTIQVVGSRKLIVQNRLEYLGLTIEPAGRGMNLNTDPDENNLVRDGDRLITGADAGHNQFHHGFTSNRMSFIGNYDWTSPSVHINLIHCYPSYSGNMLYQSYIGANSKAHIEGANVTHYGSTYLRNMIALYAFNNGSIGSIASCFLKCNIGSRAYSGNVNYYGSMFNGCQLGAEARTGQLAARNLALTGLEGPLFMNCSTALKLLGQSRSDNQVISTMNNDVDLDLDGQLFSSLSDYTSGSPGAILSILYYEEHVSM